MGYSVLADENVERQAGHYLEKRGHEVTFVVDELEPGVDDATIQQHARAHGLVVLTSDTDFTAEPVPTLFVPDDELPAFTLAEIVDTIAGHVPQDQLPRNTYVTRAWL